MRQQPHSADDLLRATLLAAAVTLACLAACIWLAGCRKREIPSDTPRPALKSWVSSAGQSMLPTFPEKCLVELEPVPFAELKAGDTVIFWDYTGGRATFIHHRLVAQQAGAWIAQGDNPATNPVADRPWVTPDNYIARTTGRWAYLLAP